MTLSHDFRAVPVHAILVEMRPADEADWGNARIRQALWARRFCPFAADVGHNNEVGRLRVCVVDYRM